MGWVLLAHVLGLLHYLSKRSALRQHLVLRARQKIVMQTIREETARRAFASYLHPFPFTSHPPPFITSLPAPPLPLTYSTYKVARRCSKLLGPNPPP